MTSAVCAPPEEKNTLIYKMIDGLRQIWVHEAWRYAHAEIRTQVVVICDPMHYQVNHGGTSGLQDVAYFFRIFGQEETKEPSVWGSAEDGFVKGLSYLALLIQSLVLLA